MNGNLAMQINRDDEFQAGVIDLSFDFDTVLGGENDTLSDTKVSPADALILSLNKYGKVNLIYMSERTGMGVRDIITALKGSIYQNPETWDGQVETGWETADEYLSGNIYEKWIVARRANMINPGYFADNVSALRKVMPKMVAFNSIYVTLGTPWLPVDMVEDFIRYLLDIREEIGLKHDEERCVWEFENMSSLKWQADYTKLTYTFGTGRMDALHIIEKSLNMQSIQINDAVDIGGGKKKYVINQVATMEATEKQKKIRSLFVEWLGREEERRKRIEQIYADKYGRIRTRNFDGSFLELPGLNENVMLFPYQKNAVARILLSPNVLLAHDVGAGKTYVMAVAGMELRRMGISKKNLYVVPNNIVEQWYKTFKSLYSKANIFVVDSKSFAPSKRQETLKTVRDGDFDAVIMAYSCFTEIPLSNDYEADEYENNIAELRKKVQDPNCTNEAKRALWDVLKKYAKWKAEHTLESKEIAFDDLGINTLFVDEAHNFKNVPYKTFSGCILGLNPTGSEKCQDMMNKVRCVQKYNDGRGVVFATGTPITNSISDLFIIQKYLQNGLLNSLNLSTFDAWIANFAELVTGFEVDVDSTGYRLVKRFSKFHNLPELTSILSLIADFHAVAVSESMPYFSGYTDCKTNKTKELKYYIEKLSNRASLVRQHNVSRKEDNMLKITSDGRQSALDLRLVQPKEAYSPEFKINQCAKQVVDIYHKYYAVGGTQIVFCDVSTPKSGFNAYDELKRILVDYGIPSDEIEFVHSATTEKSREKLFEKFRRSELRVLIGSTWKVGMGVNVQDRLVAIHHLDVPWRPADMVQREGRILRPGNLNEKVFIYRYITEGTFDAYSWQLLETKQRFIENLLSGSLRYRDGSDVGDTVLNYAEVKALAVGDKTIKRRVELCNELSRTLTLQKRTEELRLEMAAQIDQLPEFIEKKQRAIEDCTADIEYYEDNKDVYSWEQLKTLGKNILEGLKNNVYETNERKVAEYQGFEIRLPAGMTFDDQYVIVSRRGEYKLEFKDTGIGIMMRLNNLLDGLDKVLDTYKEDKLRLECKLEGLKYEIEHLENYGDKIAELKEELQKIDKKLGVSKQ